MKWRSSYLAAGRQTIRALCAYELVALHTRRLPTLSWLCHRYRRSWRGRAVMTVLLGWLLFHLWLEAD